VCSESRQRVAVDTDSESLEGDVVGPRQLCPLSRFELSLDDWLARRIVLARHAVRNADGNWALDNAHNVRYLDPASDRQANVYIELTILCSSQSFTLNTKAINAPS